MVEIQIWHLLVQIRCYYLVQLSQFEMSLTVFYSVSLLLSFMSVLLLHHHHHLHYFHFHCPNVINFVVRLYDPNYYQVSLQ